MSIFLWLAAFADDWPCYRGPNRNGISAEKVDREPSAAWKVSVGTGFSSVSVSKRRLYTMGNENDQDTVWCLDAATGAKIWTFAYEADRGARNFEGGPTATPMICGDHVYTLSRRGEVFCLQAASGKPVWSLNVNKDMGFRIPTWGFAGSPWAHENALFLNVGESGIALDRHTGKKIWASGDADAAGYSTPLPFRHDGKSYAIFSSGDAYVAASLDSGTELWRLPWVTRYGVNAADPILSGDQVFFSSGYSRGAALANVAGGKIAWENKNMRNQFNSSVLIDGFVYGFDGDTDGRPALKCVELKTGEARWSQPGLGSLSAADGKLIVLSDKGELSIAPASPKGFSPTARVNVLEGKCWTAPVLSNGRIYCRNADGDLACVEVKR